MKPLLLNSFLRLYSHISSVRRREFSLLLLLMIFASFAEMISIASVIPFLAALTNPEKIFSNHLLNPFIKVLGIEDSSQMLIPFTLIFCLFAFLSGAIRLSLLRLSNRISFATGADLSKTIYQKTLYQPYIVHLERNTSEIINGIYNKTNLITYSVILPLLLIISSFFMLITILSVLIYVDPLVCIGACVSLGSVYFIIGFQTKSIKIKNSHVIAEGTSKIIKSLQEGLGGVRDVLIDGTQKVYLDDFAKLDLSVRKSQASNQFVAQSPRYIIESLGVMLIAGLALYLLQSDASAFGGIPLLGFLALGAQRLLPIIQNSYSAWSSIQGSYRSLTDALDLLEQPMPFYYDCANQMKLDFINRVELHGVSFRYPIQDKKVLSDICLSINKGERVGIVGATGNGKTTLVDILMGLLEPTSGFMSVDGAPINRENVRAWQRNIAHVPQTIFLADKTIAENIAFGVELIDIDWNRVRIAAEKAQLQKVIDGLPDGYNSIVGERGVRLSGGQRQRIGIARAMYKNASLLIFDEATSSLDNQTEDLVMRAIDSLGPDITVIMIAHRVTTLKKCTKVIELGEGGVVKLDSYKNMINPSK